MKHADISVRLDLCWNSAFLAMNEAFFEQSGVLQDHNNLDNILTNCETMAENDN